MTLHPRLKRHALAAFIGFTAGVLLWLLAQGLYAKAQEDDTVAVDGCARSLGLEPMECA